MKIYLLLLLILISHFSYCQIELKSSKSDFNEDADLHELDAVLQNVRVICVGESTHGTHEFFTMRHRLFKFLVENHGFKTFFLEADFGACLSANQYVHGEHDDVNKAIKNIRLWPWITEEMFDLLNWMRAYNQRNENQLSFLGCDVQFFNDAQRELDNIIYKYEASLVDTTMQLTKAHYGNQPSVDSTKLRQIIVHKKEVLSNLTLDPDDYASAMELLQNMSQARILAESNEFYTRDVLMGKNMKEFLIANPESKVFYWAHNGHVIDNLEINKDGDTVVCSAGSYLKNYFKQSCLLVLQDFKEGSFNVLVENEAAEKSKKGKWKMEEISLPTDKKLISSSFDYQSSRIWMISSSEISQYKQRRIRSIGAVYRKTKNHEKSSHFWFYKEQYCDWIIFHDKSTPTKLISGKQ